MPPEESEDPGALLAEYARTGDPLLFERIDRLLRRPAEAFARSILRDPGLSADAVQNALIALAARAADYDPARPFRRYWNRLLANAVFDQYRTRKRTRKHEARAASERDELYCADRDDVFEAGALQALLATAPSWVGELLDLLSAGLTHGEVAERMGRPLGTIHRLTIEAKLWVFRARGGSRSRRATPPATFSSSADPRSGPTYFSWDELRGTGA